MKKTLKVRFLSRTVAFKGYFLTDKVSVLQKATAAMALCFCIATELQVKLHWRR